MGEARYSSNRVAWGTGRVAFRANVAIIQDLLDEGWPRTKVYERVKDGLAGMSYRQFTDHVLKHQRSTAKNLNVKRETTRHFITSNETTMVVAPEERGSVSNEKPKAPGKPAKFLPGPRVPDPSQLY